MLLNGNIADKQTDRGRGVVMTMFIPTGCPQRVGRGFGSGFAGQKLKAQLLPVTGGSCS